MRSHPQIYQYFKTNAFNCVTFGADDVSWAGSGSAGGVAILAATISANACRSLAIVRCVCACVCACNAQIYGMLFLCAYVCAGWLVHFKLPVGFVHRFK